MCISSILSINAQTEQLLKGDLVIINPSTKTYLTGEKPSAWVYKVPHLISQIGSKSYPDGILLNIAGANSWLSKTDVTKLYSKYENKQETIVEQKTIIKDTVYITQQSEPQIIHDTIYQSPIVQLDTIIMQSPEKKTRFQINGNLIGLGGNVNAGVGAELIFGARMSEYVFIGGGIRLEQNWLDLKENVVHGTQFPIFANVKAYFPIQNMYYPYVDMSTGLNLGKFDHGQSDLGRKSGIYCGLFASVGVGFDYKCLSLGLGYQYGNGCSPIENDYHHAYLKIGFVFISDK